MKNVTKVLTVVCFIVMGFFIGSVNATPLIQIEVGDTWSYNVTTDSTELVNFTVVDYDYAGDGEDQVRINEITSTSIVDPLISEMFLGRVFDFVEMSVAGGTLGLELQFNEIISDTIYKTARGNIPFKRDTVVNVSFIFTDVNFNGSSLGDFTYTNEVHFMQESDTPSIIESVATGVVKMNNKKVHSRTAFADGLFGISDYTEIDFDLMLEERYEASDEFVYLNQTCRNITITPINCTATYLEILGNVQVGAFNWLPVEDFQILPLNVGEENWIYGYDIGLPLTIEKKPNLPTQVKLALTVDDTVNMELVNFNIQNSEYEFPKEEEETELTSIMFIPVGVAAILSIVLWNKNRKTK